MKNLFRIARLLLLAGILLPAGGTAQPLVRRALFLGNSYTYVNDLPALVAGLASAAGDSLISAQNTPGGYTLGWQPVAHATNPVSTGLITAGGWDFVVIQEQSQIPSITRLRDSCMFPAAVSLNGMIKAASPCARSLFFLTWGRRFGGMQCFTPNYCSPAFTGFGPMQDSITVSYKRIADSLGGWIAPAGEAWRLAIDQGGIVLHDGDGSHPNLNGSYLAACVFYAVMFGKPSQNNGFTAGLAPDTALALQLAADSVTFGMAAVWNLNNDVPEAAFETVVSGDTLFLQNLSAGAATWIWDFGDGQTSSLFEPFHLYAQPGIYRVSLHSCNPCFCDSVSRDVPVMITGSGGRPGTTPPTGLTGPDRNGRVRFTGFHENGWLALFDPMGRSLGRYRVSNGEATLGSSRPRVVFWTLTTDQGRIAGRGKIF